MGCGVTPFQARGRLDFAGKTSSGGLDYTGWRANFLRLR